MYVKDSVEAIEDKALADKVTIVYEIIQESEALYMDIFKEKLYEKPTYVIPGILSFAPFVRKGLTVKEVISLSDLLNLERMQLKELEVFYKEIENLHYNEFLEMFKEQFNSLFDNGFKR